jgi:hypothetical protein
MNRLLFKQWMLSEMADFGFDNDQRGKPKGGIEAMDGDTLFKAVDGSKIITELASFPALGPNRPLQRWNDVVEWGVGPGAIQVGVTPLGSMRVVVRRMTKDLCGEATWICTKVIPLGDNAAENKETAIAHDVYDTLTEVSNEMVPGPAKEYDELERLSWKLWAATKRQHPSYCMFPIGVRQQNENYYKLVFEFRGHGVNRQKSGSGGGRAEQFNIDMVWEPKRGLIRCLGYDIDSSTGQHSWEVQPAEFNEYYSPQQKHENIIDSIVQTFLQY